MMKILSISKEKGVPEVEVFIGHAHVGKYRLLLLGGERGTEDVGEGVNVDEIEDKFDIGTSVDDLDDRILSWEIIIASFGGGPGESYYARVSITQDGDIVQNGLFEYGGGLEGGNKPIFEYARLKVS